ncbi:serine threonine protein kinase CMGC group [Savitreella phatthalungensis]
MNDPPVHSAASAGSRSDNIAISPTISTGSRHVESSAPTTSNAHMFYGDTRAFSYMDTGDSQRNPYVAYSNASQQPQRMPIRHSASSSGRADYNPQGSEIILIEDSPDPQRRPPLVPPPPAHEQLQGEMYETSPYRGQYGHQAIIGTNPGTPINTSPQHMPPISHPGPAMASGATTRRMAAAAAAAAAGAAAATTPMRVPNMVHQSTQTPYGMGNLSSSAPQAGYLSGGRRRVVPPPLYNFTNVPIFPVGGYMQNTLQTPPGTASHGLINVPPAVPGSAGATLSAWQSNFPNHAVHTPTRAMSGVGLLMTGDAHDNGMLRLQQAHQQQLLQNEAYARQHQQSLVMSAQQQPKRKRDDLAAFGVKTNQREVAGESHSVLQQQRQYYDDMYNGTQQQPMTKPKANKNREVLLRKEYSSHFAQGKIFDDKEGHYKIVPNTALTSRYRIVKLLGQGTFGKVVEAYDTLRKTSVAIKIIRAIQKYRDASMIELRVLRSLNESDPSNKNKCIHLRDCFDYRNHVCIVTDLLQMSIYDFLQQNEFAPFPARHIQELARQLFTSVAFLHRELRLVHTDLKPENILLVDATFAVEPYPSGQSQSRTRRILRSPEIRLIDFGSATFEDEYHSNVVSTRHYRAPEIILGLGWSYPCDVWSVGCILVELLLGDALFQTHDDLEHLAMMQVVCGRIDGHLVRAASQSAKKLFRPSGRLDYPNRDTSRNARKFVKDMRSLPQLLPPTSNFNNHLCDLLTKVFIYDQAKRITATQALDHAFFRTPIDVDN